MPSRRDKIGLRKLVLVIWLGALLQAFAQPVRAEVRVSGQADALIVETREASVEEVLAALRALFNLQYRAPGALTRMMTGTYTGSLQRVIARLLEGHNYVMQSSVGGGELIVFGPEAAGSSVSASRHPVVAVAEPRVLRAPNPSSDAQASGGTTPVGQPIAPPLPNVNHATQVAPSVSPSSLFPAPPSPQSVAAPPNTVVVPTPAPSPEPVSYVRPPG